MPLYEYQCQSCGYRTEVMQRFSEPPLATCTECGGDFKKLLSAPAFQFKGDGWYVTDYARKEKPDKDEGDKDTGEGKGEKGKAAKSGDSAAASSDQGTKAKES